MMALENKYPSRYCNGKAKGEHMNVEVTIYTPGEDAEPAVEGTQEEVCQILGAIRRNIDRISEKAAEYGIKKMIFLPTFIHPEERESIGTA